MKIQFKKQGFTIVELMVVVVILGILVGLSTFGYHNWQQNLAHSQAKSDLTTAATAMENSLNFNNTYPVSIPDTFKGSDLVTVLYVGGNTSGYCIEAKANKYNSIVYHVDSTVGKTPKLGTCNSSFALSAPVLSFSNINPTTLTLSWSAVSGATSYQVRYGTSTPSTPASCTSSPCDLTGLSSITNYSFSVTASSQFSTITGTGNATTTSNFSAIALSSGNGCAIISSKAYCWGIGAWGAIGDGTMASSNTPVIVPALSGMTTSVIESGSKVSCAVANSVPYCWGDNDVGQLGDGTNTDRTTPVVVSGFSGMTVTSINQYNGTTCAIANGAAYCWGRGPLGDGTTTNSTTPRAVTGFSGKTVTDIDVGAYHTCAVAAGAAYCWGNGGGGAIGDGASTSRTTPTLVSGFAGKTVTAVSAGNSHSCAVADGAAYCWGGNGYGQLGDGTKTGRTTPVPVQGMSGRTVVELSSNFENTCAIASGAAYCWGDNSVNQIGDGTTTERLIATPVTGLSGKTVTKLASGGAGCVIAASAGYCWGFGAYGQLGNGADANSSQAVKVTHP